MLHMERFKVVKMVENYLKTVVHLNYNMGDILEKLLKRAQIAKQLMLQLTIIVKKMRKVLDFYNLKKVL